MGTRTGERERQPSASRAAWPLLGRPKGLVGSAVLATLAGLFATTGAAALPARPEAAPAADASPVSVIVRETAAAGSAPEAAVRAAGGAVERRLGLIGGFSATVPAEALPALRRAPGVASVTADAPLRLTSALDEVEEYATQPGSMAAVARVTGAADLWNAGLTGKGVDVALIDSGVVPVDGLSGPDKVVRGPDLSFEADDCSSGECVPSPARDLDSFGHGTHMAGIIAGRDDAAPAAVRGDSQHFLGMAPDARIVSIKVADADGATDVSQVIAAIDWVVRNRSKHGLDIRVLNLSFGTDGVQDYQLDPLSYAAEVAWHRGIVVVVAAGNAGSSSAQLSNPAYNPWVLAVGASDGQGTDDVSDDVVPDWSSTGDGTRDPDLVAPGKSVLSLRNPGSFIDSTHPTARFGSRFFRGSGTSQAAAVVAGASALLAQQRPAATPDQIKALLTGTAQTLPGVDVKAQGAGVLDLRRAAAAETPQARQRWARANGTGSLEGARGTDHVVFGGEPLAGEVDVTGRPWRGMRAFAALWAGHTWDGHTWGGHTWAGHTWAGHTWAGHTWAGHTWAGHTWGGYVWDGHTWGGHTWDGHTWGGHTWGGHTWGGHTWGGHTWDGMSWSSSGWPGADEPSAP